MKKRILFDIVHPADVLLFKNTALKLQEKYNILFAARKKDVTEELLQSYSLPFVTISEKKKKNSFKKQAEELISRTLKTLSLIKNFSPHLLVGTSPSMALASFLTKIPSLYFDEDDPLVKKSISFTTVPFVNFYCIPDILKTSFFKYKQLSYPSLHELAYLHPDYFKPDLNVLKKLNLSPSDNFFLLRFVNLTASHDIGEKGLSFQDKINIISLLENYGKVFISSETPLPYNLRKYQLKIPPQELHSFIFFANTTICDSQTVAAESALLGTPSLRYNSFVGRISYLADLEKAGLSFGFHISEKGKFLEKILEIVKTPKFHLKSRQRKLLQKYLKNKIYLTDWIISLIEKNLNRK